MTNQGAFPLGHGDTAQAIWRASAPAEAGADTGTDTGTDPKTGSDLQVVA